MHPPPIVQHVQDRINLPKIVQSPFNEHGAWLFFFADELDARRRNVINVQRGQGAHVYRRVALAFDVEKQILAQPQLDKVVRVGRADDCRAAR